MENAQVLVRMVARAFYDVDHVVVVDALVIHSALNVEDLRTIFVNSSKHKQDIQKLIGRLREGGLVSVFARQETKANAQKPTTVEYYYIDYRRAIDGTKYRLHALEEKLRRQAGPAEEKKEYRCQRCKSEYTEIQVIHKPDPQGRNSGFLCDNCDFPLDYFPNDGENPEADGPVGQFNRNLSWLIELLKEIDNTTVPAVTGESALRDQIPVPKEKALLEAPKLETFDAPRMRPATVKGIVTGPEKVEISITTDSESTAAAQAAAAEQKARAAAQNQLPEWHTRSTVTNEMTAAGQREEAAKREREVEAGSILPDGTENKKAAQDGELDAVFAMIDAQREAERGEDEGTEEEDEEFEDVTTDATPDAKKAKMELSDTKVDTSASNTPAPADAEESEEEFEDVA